MSDRGREALGWVIGILGILAILAVVSGEIQQAPYEVVQDSSGVAQDSLDATQDSADASGARNWIGTPGSQVHGGATEFLGKWFPLLHLAAVMLTAVYLLGFVSRGRLISLSVLFVLLGTLLPTGIEIALGPGETFETGRVAEMLAGRATYFGETGGLLIVTVAVLLTLMFTVDFSPTAMVAGGVRGVAGGTRWLTSRLSAMYGGSSADNEPDRRAMTRSEPEPAPPRPAPRRAPPRSEPPPAPRRPEPPRQPDYEDEPEYYLSFTDRVVNAWWDVYEWVAHGLWRLREWMWPSTETDDQEYLEEEEEGLYDEADFADGPEDPRQAVRGRRIRDRRTRLWRAEAGEPGLDPGAGRGEHEPDPEDTWSSEDDIPTDRSDPTGKTGPSTVRASPDDQTQGRAVTENDLGWETAYGAPGQTPAAPARKRWRARKKSAGAVPPLDLLDEAEGGARPGLDDAELQRLGDVLIDKLQTFKIEGEIEGWTTGPVVTRFEVVPAAGVKVGQITAREADLALALAARSVRIVAPIPGRGAVGVEIPNPEPRMVRLRSVLETRSYRDKGLMLPVALGSDLAGVPICTDLTRMPHLLLAGQTGSGKSICINTLITSLIYRHGPDRLRLLMVDPKMVELSIYADLPHLLYPVITDSEDAATLLKWAVWEMNRRFECLAANQCRNLQEFNDLVASGKPIAAPKVELGKDPAPEQEGPLPFIVVIIDELADLMMTVRAEVETPLARIAQKARAVGMHLVLATQRPSVNVLTGLIKANIPSRIAFRVASMIDSRTILDQNGAESLLGNGDMLFLPPGRADPERLQGAFISSAETQAVLGWYREQTEEAGTGAEEAGDAAAPDILSAYRKHEAAEAGGAAAEEGERDQLFQSAAEIVVANQAGSTSLLQRRLKIGYGRAARIVDQLHLAGVLGPPDGAKPREVLMSLEDLEGII